MNLLKRSFSVSMQAVILAGGLGTRLKPIIADLPKPMAPILDKPFLEYQMRELKKNGIENILVLIAYKGEVIKKYFGDGSEFGLKIQYSEEIEPLGTAGALFNAWDSLENEFYLINGDTFFHVQYELIDDFVKSKNVKALVSLRLTEDVKRYGSVEQRDFKVTEFVEKGQLPESRVDGYINGGLYFFHKSILKDFYDSYHGISLSLERDILPSFAKEDKLFGLPLGGAFIDIGEPEDYERAKSLIPHVISEERVPAVFLDRDGVIVEDTGYVYGTKLKFIERTFEIVRNANLQGKKVIVITNQAGVARGYYTEEDVVSTNEYIREVYARKHLVINSFFYCPYHPDGIVAEYKKASLCRKPSPGMILKACEQMVLDIKNSVIIGDKETDRVLLFGISFQKTE